MKKRVVMLVFLMHCEPIQCMTAAHIMWATICSLAAASSVAIRCTNKDRCCANQCTCQDCKEACHDLCRKNQPDQSNPINTQPQIQTLLVLKNGRLQEEHRPLLSNQNPLQSITGYRQ